MLMQDVQQTVDERIERFADDSRVNGDFTELAKRWASHSLETYKDELLTKALAISKALSEFDSELIGKET